jgi:small-conductance mechanosensitive channel/CRP-like cAMP-binding protein
MAAVSFWSLLVAEAIDDLSLALAAALVVSAILVRTAAPEERRRLRGFTILTLLHLALLPVLAALRGQESEWYTDVRLTALVFAILAAAGMVSTLVFGIVLPRVGLRAPRILRDVLMAVVAVIATIAAADRLGFPVTGVITTSAILTAVIGFALQDTLGNIIGGLALQMDHSVVVGDWVKIGDVRGRVVDIRWRYTAIETRNWETVILPNGMLMKGQVIVEGRRAGQPEQVRRWVYFNVDFRTPPSQVIELVDEALRSTPIQRVATEPPPNCVLMELGESYGRYAARYWLTDLAADDLADSVVRTRIYFALRRAGVPLSIPAHAVFLTEESSERKQEKGRQDLERRHAALARVDLFDMLDDTTHGKLAERLSYAPFSRGEAITRQGSEGHYLYMLVAGEAAVRVSRDGDEREVARLKPGNFFGEMSLLTGAQRSATVIALTDVECFRLDKESFQEILRERPEITEGVAAILAQRQVSLLAAREDLDAAARERCFVEDKHMLLNKIRDFFGLLGDRPARTAS